MRNRQIINSLCTISCWHSGEKWDENRIHKKINFFFLRSDGEILYRFDGIP